MTKTISLITTTTYLAAFSLQNTMYSSVAFIPARIIRNGAHRHILSSPLRMSTSSDVGDKKNEHLLSGISRVETLQSLLSKHGAPGSRDCTLKNDLVPVNPDSSENDELLDLHPHLVPIAKSTSSGNYVCGFRRISDPEIGISGTSWPIVESGVKFRGIKLLALNSEHFMRRMACEADDAGAGEEIVKMYNEGLGQGDVTEAALDVPYQTGSVAELGYGVEKYTLLRVGPFPDLYRTMSRQHRAKGDEKSSLIAAEAANGKFTGFASNFASYAKLLNSFPNREEEVRDAARQCLRMSIPTVGMTSEDFAEVSRYTGLATEDDSTDEAIEKMRDMYQKYRDHEQEDDPDQTSKTPEQVALDEATYLLDAVSFNGGDWRSAREELGEIYIRAGNEDMAKFVNPADM